MAEEQAGPISIKTYTGPTSTYDAKNHMLTLMSQGKNAAMIGDKRGETVVVRPGKLSQKQQTQARSTLLQRKLKDPSIQKEADSKAKLAPSPEKPRSPTPPTAKDAPLFKETTRPGDEKRGKFSFTINRASGGQVYRGRKYARGGRVAKYKG